MSLYGHSCYTSISLARSKNAKCRWSSCLMLRWRVYMPIRVFKKDPEKSERVCPGVQPWPHHPLLAHDGLKFLYLRMGNFPLSPSQISLPQPQNGFPELRSVGAQLGWEVIQMLHCQAGEPCAGNLNADARPRNDVEASVHVETADEPLRTRRTA